MNLFLIDSSSFIYRCYHTYPQIKRRSDGLPVNAVKGFCEMLWKLLTRGDPTGVEEYASHIAAVFDAGKQNFRHEIYPKYKANRTSAPDDLKVQFPFIRQACEAFGVATAQVEGYEADDVINSLTKKWSVVYPERVITIFSSDKDLMQLLTESWVFMVDTMRNKRHDMDSVKAKFGVSANRLTDLLALAGDSSDNVPGVPRIGIKKAADLVNRFGILEKIYDKIESVENSSIKFNLEQFKDQAYMSKELVTLKYCAPKLSLSDLEVREFDASKLFSFLEEMELELLIRKIEGTL